MKFSEILSQFRQGKTSAKSHMKNLIEMAAVDGNFDDIEFDLLKDIAQKHGISENQLKEIQTNPNEIEFEIPKDPTEKFNQLYDLVLMMTIDKIIYKEEVNLCAIFAGKFGYKKERIGEIIDAITNNIQNDQKPEETMKRVEWMLD